MARRTTPKQMEIVKQEHLLSNQQGAEEINLQKIADAVADALDDTCSISHVSKVLNSEKYPDIREQLIQNGELESMTHDRVQEMLYDRTVDVRKFLTEDEKNKALEILTSEEIMSDKSHRKVARMIIRKIMNQPTCPEEAHW